MKPSSLLIFAIFLFTSSCEEVIPEQYCTGEFSTPPSAMSKFEKWNLPSYFRGFNISYYCYKSDCVKSQEDFDALKATGANLAQINVYGEGFRSFTSPFEVDEVGKQHIICMANWAHNAGLYYTIAVREGPGRYDVAKDRDSPIWQNSKMQEAYGDMLSDIAAEFMNDSLFVGLVLTVEPDPFAADYDSAEDYINVLQSNNVNLYEINKLWINKVRSVSEDLPLMVQSAASSNPEFWGNDIFIKKQEDPHIVYEVHSYEPFDYTHASRTDKETYPFTGWNISTNNNKQVWDRSFYESTVFKNVFDFQATHNVPIYLGEFGMQFPQLNGDRYLMDIYEVALSKGWSFSLWSWRSDLTPSRFQFNYELFDENSSASDYWGIVQQMMH